MATTEDLKNPGDFETIARSTVPSDLEIIKALLESEGIPAFILDGGINQVYSLIAVATGGARLQVASEYVDAARQILMALDAGQLALDDDADVAEEESGVTPDERKRRAFSAALLIVLGGG